MLPRLAVLLVSVSLLPAQPVVSASGESMRLKSSSVAANGSGFDVLLVMNDDNGNAGLATSWRRWWQCEIRNLRTSGETLFVQVQNAGYSDIILPAWSLSTNGTTFGAWTRVPLSALPTYAGSTHRFTLPTPANVVALRLAVFFPYTITQRDAWLATINGHPRVRSLTSLGNSGQGRSIPILEITDSSVPDAGKLRVWIQAGIHPAETTSYFTVEGLVQELLSGQIATEILLDKVIFDIVPMANPDGVFLGNYRTNAGSVNLEDQWAAPYSSTVPEIVALRTRIEQLMGTPQAPGTNPIEVLLNLHSSHDVSYPFHFQHVSNPSFNLTTSRTGVIPLVNALEGGWIAAFESRSAFAKAGTTQSSTMGAPARPFVEAMMHDRWSIDPLWTRPKVMAITFEGTYGKGPDLVSWCTPDDYRRCGREMAWAVMDHLGLLPGATITRYGTSCGGPDLGGAMLATMTRLDLLVTSAPPALPAWLVFGTTQQSIPLPPNGCPLRTDPLVLVPITIDALGAGKLLLNLPPLAALQAHVQCASLDLAMPTWATSNGLIVQIAR